VLLGHGRTYSRCVFFINRHAVFKLTIGQYSPQEKLSLKLKIGDEEVSEEGSMFSEATFIS
jgi:hypothetical protein